MDEIIERVGNFGPFQALLFSATASTVALSASGTTFMMYGMYNPGWNCQNNAIAGGSNLTSLNTSSSSYDASSCSSWRKCNDVVFDQSASTIVTEWNLLCDNAWKASVMITVQMVGVILGACACGPVGDRFGRKVGLYTGVAIQAVANLVCAFSTSWQMFTALRFCIGLGVGCIVAIGFFYPMEFVCGWWRPVIMSIPIWSIGAMVGSLISLAFKDWRNIHFMISGISLVCFLPVFWVPESIRWLAVQKNADNINNVVRRMASWNRKPPIHVDVVNEIIRRMLESQSKVAKPNYLDLFKTKKLRKYSIKFGLTGFTAALVYYMITFSVKTLSGNIYLNMILFALIEIPCLLCVGPMANKFGRRFTCCFLLTLAGVTCLGNALVDLSLGSQAGTVSLALVIVSKGALISTWSALSIFSAELYPTVVRTLQSSCLNVASYMGAMLSGYMLPADGSKIFISFIVSGILLFLGVGLIFSLNDSKGRRMIDTIQEMKENPFLKEDEETKT